MMKSGWIGVDLDGTLAEFDAAYWVQHPYEIGKPVVSMVDRVNKWLHEGRDVRIFTARVAVVDWTGLEEAGKQRDAIEAWCLQVFGRALPVTATKDYTMVQCWDDRAVSVELNTGWALNANARQWQHTGTDWPSAGNA